MDPQQINKGQLPHDDPNVLQKYLEYLEPNNKFYIDIGAGYRSNLTDSLIRNSDLTIFFEGQRNPNRSFMIIIIIILLAVQVRNCYKKYRK